MAITLTKKVTQTFANGRPNPGNSDSVSAVVQAYVAEQVALGKTDGVDDVVDDNSHTRLWVDQASAQAFVDFCAKANQEIGRTDYTGTITDV
jgi:hypothetical protein